MNQESMTEFSLLLGTEIYGFHMPDDEIECFHKEYVRAISTNMLFFMFRSYNSRGAFDVVVPRKTLLKSALIIHVKGESE